MAQSKIEWTEMSWNWATGCSKVSAGCQNCYAEKFARRLQAMGKKKYRNGFKITVHPECLGEPLHWRKPRIIFVNSMSDTFHEDIPDEFIEKAFMVMRDNPQHRYIILTKRSKRMRDFSNRWYGSWPDKNVIGMATAENQEMADLRIPDLLASNFHLRGLSLEPLLGEIDLNSTIELLDWVIVGGESGHNARPMHPDWVRSIRDQCKDAKVPFFFKQWGEYEPLDSTKDGEVSLMSIYGIATSKWIDKYDYAFLRVGKKKAGRCLDESFHNELPWGNDG